MMQFIDLQAQRKRLGSRIDEAIGRVLEHGRFIMGPEVAELEERLGDFCDARNVVTCSSGTDALWMALRALEIGAGDAVFVPTLTFVATAEAVVLTGATPVMVDVDPQTFNIDVDSLAAAVKEVEADGDLRSAAVIAVDLYGQPADYDRVETLTREHGLKLICDAAQSFGASHRDRRVGTIGDVTTTSFFPAKPLGCYGDGGAVFCADDEIAATLRSLRIHGGGRDKFDNVRIGINGRLDTIQAAILLEKLSVFADEIDRRRGVAARYTDALAERVDTPVVLDAAETVWAQYTIKVDARDDVAAEMRSAGIPTSVHGRTPMHLQSAYVDYPRAAAALPCAEAVAGTILSLPMHPYLESEAQDEVIEALVGALK